MALKKITDYTAATTPLGGTEAFEADLAGVPKKVTARNLAEYAALQQVTTGISAAGATQATATAITNDYNVVSTVAAATGVILPTATVGRKITVSNRGANALLVYPATGAAIDALAANAGYSLAVNGVMEFDATSTTQWYAKAQDQPTDATLTALAAQNWVNNSMPVGTGADSMVQLALAANTFLARDSASNIVAKTITDFAFTLLDDADAATMRATIGAEATIAAGTTAQFRRGDNSWSNTLLGPLGIGAAPPASAAFYNAQNITGAVTAYGNSTTSTVQSDVTSNAYGNFTGLSTQAAAFTLTSLFHYSATQNTIGAGSTVTSQYGFHAANTLIGATNNYGFYGAIPAGTNRYNLYMAGTAFNYLAGNVGIGVTPDQTVNLYLLKALTGGTAIYNIHSGGAVQSDVTSEADYFISVASTQAASFTLTTLNHFIARQSTIGAGSTVTNQTGFSAAATLIGATNNYGFYGGIAAGTNRWNVYMVGTALNHFAGAVLIGSTTDDTVNKLQVTGNVALKAIGNGYRVKEGSNAKMGVATLVAGAVVVSNTSVTANSRIFLTGNSDGGTPGWVRVSARTASTSFTITSSSATDTGTVAWIIFEPT